MKNSKGITLIALIITIIVMVILTGVVLSITTSENSVIKQAEKANKTQSYAEVKEEVLLQTEYITTSGSISVDLNKTLDNIDNLNSDLIDYENTAINDDSSALTVTLTNGEIITINAQVQNSTGSGNQTPTTPVESKMTLNPNLDDFKTAFDEGYYYKTWGPSQYANAILTYTNGSESISISVYQNDTMPSGLYVYVNYKNSNSETISYACSSTGSPRGDLENAKTAGTVYDFVEAGRWQMFKGTYFTGNYEYSGTARVYEDFTETAIFPGNWTIDEANSNDLGKAIFEKVLINVN